MDIYTPPGAKVRFTGIGGYENENARARCTLAIGKVYTVVSVDVGSWSSKVYLEGHKHPFNTVMFENVNGLDQAAERIHGDK